MRVERLNGLGDHHPSEYAIQTLREFDRDSYTLLSSPSEYSYAHKAGLDIYNRRNGKYIVIVKKTSTALSQEIIESIADRIAAIAGDVTLTENSCPYPALEHLVGELSASIHKKDGDLHNKVSRLEIVQRTVRTQPGFMFPSLKLVGESLISTGQGAFVDRGEMRELIGVGVNIMYTSYKGLVHEHPNLRFVGGSIVTLQNRVQGHSHNDEQYPHAHMNMGKHAVWDSTLRAIRMQKLAASIADTFPEEHEESPTSHGLGLSL